MGSSKGQTARKSTKHSSGTGKGSRSGGRAWGTQPRKAAGKVPRKQLATKQARGASTGQAKAPGMPRKIGEQTSSSSSEAMARGAQTQGSVNVMSGRRKIADTENSISISGQNLARGDSTKTRVGKINGHRKISGN